MIDKNKYQCWEYPNDLLLIANNKCQFHEQKINDFEKRNMNAEKKELVLKTDMNINNNKINNCSKQISMLTKQNYWLLNKRPMVTTLKWMISKNKCQCFEQANESLLKRNINVEKK